MSKNSDTFYTVTNKSAESKSVDILMYGAIPSWDDDTYKMKNTAEKFVKDFQALEKDYDRINIKINSPGGSLYHGFPIYNAIVSSKKDVHTYNDGLAASLAGLILLAGKTVHSAKNAILMIHNSNAFAIGHAEDMRDVATKLDTYDEAVAQHFADKSGKDLQAIKDQYLNYKDHYLSSAKAKEEGFVDIIEDKESADAPPENIQNMSFEEVYAFYRPQHPDAHQERGLFQRFASQIKDLFNLTETEAPEQSNEQSIEQSAERSRSADPNPEKTGQVIHQSPISTNINEPSSPPNQPENNMDFKNSLTLLGKETLSAEDITAIKAEISQFTGVNEKFTADEVTAKVTEATTNLSTEITHLKNEKANLATQVTALTSEKEAITQEVTGLKLDIQAYRKSGVQIANSAGEKEDQIQGEDPVDNFYSESDAALKRMKAEAGLA
jgi:ATP-dependent Clp endopeptidase proteolytic subunit ClpP